MRHWHYTGDLSVEYGGFFYCLDTWKDGYVDALRVTPCSDAGGPDNCFWIELITIIIPDTGSGREQDALRYCGWFDGGQAEEWKKLTKAQRRHALVYACESYGLYDPHDLGNCGMAWSTMIRIGPVDPFWSGTDKYEPNVILRAGVSLRNYAMKIIRKVYG